MFCRYEITTALYLLSYSRVSRYNIRWITIRTDCVTGYSFNHTDVSVFIPTIRLADTRRWTISLFCPIVALSYLSAYPVSFAIRTVPDSIRKTSLCIRMSFPFFSRRNHRLRTNRYFQTINSSKLTSPSEINSAQVSFRTFFLITVRSNKFDKP